jgi:autotransporter-associated beta strand protein
MTTSKTCGWIRIGLRLAASVVLPVAASAQTLTITNGVQTYASLTNTTVTMSNHCELRVTATNNPIPGCTINLTSADAWFFLPNIRPSVVSANYLAQVKVNGVAAVAGSNCRLDQYAMGAVIIPQSPSFTPLQVFSGQNFLGTSAQLGLYTYYNTTAALGAMMDNISSFKLKRGYSATFAQNADGTGVSQVFVAQDGDLEIGVLSTNLDHLCSFVRVFPWRWTGKKGWAGAADSTGTMVDPLWSYDWDNATTSTLDTEYVPMRHDLNWDAYANINSKQKSTHALGFNEPDQANQANMTVAVAIANWPNLVASGLRVGAPAVSSSGVTGQGPDWLYSFMSSATNLGYRVDYVPVHWYKCDQSAAQFYSYLLAIYQTTGRPVWVTEFNNGEAGCSDATTITYSQNATKISQFITMLESAPFVERYAIYEWEGTNLQMVANDGTLTPAGQIYHNQQSALAYTQTLPSGGSRSIAQFEFETNTLDSSGYGNNAFARGIPGYTTGHSGQAVTLDGTNSYLQLPPTVANSASFTFAAWVYWDGGNQWQRIFDFGNDTSHYLFLTPSSDGGTLRFAINNGSGEQLIETTGMTSGQWRHVAITLSGSTAKLYTNGVLAASSSSFTIVPANILPTLNYLGKSQFPDPLFRGRLDDVQIADYAFTAAQIASLQTNTPPQFTTNILAGAPAARSLAYSNSLAGAVTDANGGPLTFSKLSGPVWLNVSTSGILTGTPSASDVGTNLFTVRVTDPAGASAFTVLTITTLYNPAWGVDANGNWSDINKWNAGLVAGGAGVTADFSTLNITADRTVTLDSPFSIGALIFGDTSGAQNWNLAASGGSVLTLDSGSSAQPSITVTNNTATVSAPLAGANGFSMAGAGTLILSNANALTGTVVIGGGTVKLSHPLALQNAILSIPCAGSNALKFGPITGAAIAGLTGLNDLWLTNSSLAAVTLTNGNNNVSSEFAGAFRGTGGLVKAGTGTLTLDGTNNYTGATTISAGTVRFGSGTNFIASLQPVLWLSFDQAGSGIVTNQGRGGWAMNGTLIGSGAYITNAGRFGNALYIDGNGGAAATNIVQIANKVTDTSASSSWTLGYWIKTTTAGAVILYQGDGTWSSSGQTTYLLNANSGSTAGTPAGAVRYAGGFLTGTTALNDGNWHFITLVDTAGTETIYVDGNADAVTSSMSLALASGANQTWIGGAPDSDAGAVKISGLIDEVCVFDRALTQAQIRAIVTNAPVSGTLPAASAVNLASGATLDLSGLSQTVGSLADFSGAGGIVTNTAAVPVTLIIGNNGAAVNFSGRIDDSSAASAISLVKSGSSQQVLSGVNHYRGPTTISNGTLVVNGSLGTNADSVRGGTLAGNGVILGPVTVYAAGKLAPGSNAVGALTILNSILTLNGTTAIELDKSSATNDAVLGLTTINYGGTLTVSNLNGTLVPGDSFRIFNAAGWSGFFAATNLPALDFGLGWNFNPASGTLSVFQAVAINPTNLAWNVSTTNLTLSWPADHTGWRLLVQTNNLANGVSLNTNDWGTVPASQQTNQVLLPIDPTLPLEFYRIVYP